MEDIQKSSKWKKLVKNEIIFIDPKRMMKISFTLSIFLIMCGLTSFFLMNSIQEQKFRYDHKCFPNNFCTLDIYLKKYKKPIYIFLEMTHFFQAHKSFVEGFSRYQLAGNKIDLNEAKRKCRKAFLYKSFDVDHTIFDPLDIANPCGLLSKYFPGDVYMNLLEKKSGIDYKIKHGDIADPFFSRVFQPNMEENQWLDVKSGQFINWMVF